MMLQSWAGRVHTWPCVHSLHAHTAEMMPDSLSCLKAAAPEVRVAFHARTGPASQLEKVFSACWFLPRALFVLPVPGDAEGPGHSLACLSEHHQRGFCRGSSPGILLSAVPPNNFPNAICTPKQCFIASINSTKSVPWLFLELTTEAVQV